MKKIIETHQLKDLEIWTEDGWKPITAIHKTIPFDIWEIKTLNFSLKCADNHIIIDDQNRQIFAKDLIPQISKIQTEKGVEIVLSVQKLDLPSENMYDVTVDSPNHTFFSNGILSHNTTLLTIYSLWMACFQSDKRILIVANKEDTAIMILRRIRLAYELLPNWLKPGIKQWGQTEIIFGNDSSIGISTTTSSAAVGQTVNCLIIDEAARIPMHLQEEFWSAVIPVISAGKQSRIIMVSTACGAQGKFYEIYSQCERGENDEWHHERIDWMEIPGRDKKWKQKMIEALGSPQSFDQEFGNCFLDYGKTAADTEVLEGFKAQCINPEIELDEGDYKIWEAPQENHIYVFGIDIGEGIGGAASVIQILDLTDLTNIKQAGIYHNNKIDPFSFASKILSIAQQWGNPYLLIERNNCGGQVIDALHRVHHYENLVTYLPDNQVVDENRMGIYSHTSLKYKSVMNMRYWVNTLKVMNIYDIGTVQELETFIQYPNGTWKKKQGSSFTDDRVMSLIWALFILDPILTEQFFNIELYDEQGKPMKISYIDPNNFKIDKNAGGMLKAISYDTPSPAYFNNVPANQNMDVSNMTFEELMGSGWSPL
jgi:hypothetical protein